MYNLQNLLNDFAINYDSCDLLAFPNKIASRNKLQYNLIADGESSFPGTG